MNYFAVHVGCSYPYYAESGYKCFSSMVLSTILLFYRTVLTCGLFCGFPFGEHHLDFLSLKEAAQARLSLHLSKCHIVGNHVSRLI